MIGGVLRATRRTSPELGAVVVQPIGCIATAAVIRSGTVDVSSMMNAPPMHIPMTASARSRGGHHRQLIAAKLSSRRRP